MTKVGAARREGWSSHIRVMFFHTGVQKGWSHETHERMEGGGRIFLTADYTDGADKTHATGEA